MCQLLACCFPPCVVCYKRGPGIQFCLNIFLTLLGWLPGCIHACMIAGERDVSVNVIQQVNVAAPAAAAPQHITLNIDQQPRAQPGYPMYMPMEQPPTYTPNVPYNPNGVYPPNVPYGPNAPSYTPNAPSK